MTENLNYTWKEIERDKDKEKERRRETVNPPNPEKS